jgi:autotransporter-associated beta strand protein
MRTHLLTTTAAVALLAVTSARAQNATWNATPSSGDFNTAANWTPATVPTGTAFFGASNITSITFQPFTTTSVGALQFNPGAPAYSFSTFPALFTSINITGAGIVNSSSNAPTFIVNNQANLFFRNTSSAGDAIIITTAGGLTGFVDSATGGNARFITTAGGAFDITSLSSGAMTAGSIEGAGTFSLGPNLLTVGSNNLSTEVSGLIRGTGGSLVKVGTGTLTLSGTNSYTGATVVAGGTLSVTGDISSSSGVLVGPTAMLSGTGTVPGVLVAGGTLMPGQSVGTLNVAGNLVFTSAATYLININAVTASQTNVTGIAALNGATVQVVDDKNITKRQVYTLLTATGGISGTFNPDVVGVKNKVDLFYDANHVYLCDHCKFTDVVAGQLPFFPGSPCRLATCFASCRGPPDRRRARCRNRRQRDFAAESREPPWRVAGAGCECSDPAYGRGPHRRRAGKLPVDERVPAVAARSVRADARHGRGRFRHGLCARGFRAAAFRRGARLCIGAQGARGVGAARRCQPPLERLGLGLWRPRHYRRRSGEYRQP